MKTALQFVACGLMLAAGAGLVFAGQLACGAAVIASASVVGWFGHEDE